MPGHSAVRGYVGRCPGVSRHQFQHLPWHRAQSCAQVHHEFAAAQVACVPLFIVYDAFSFHVGSRYPGLRGTEQLNKNTPSTTGEKTLLKNDPNDLWIRAGGRTRVRGGVRETEDAVVTG